jgi:hypothetical protein
MYFSIGYYCQTNAQAQNIVGINIRNAQHTDYNTDVLNRTIPRVITVFSVSHTYVNKFFLNEINFSENKFRDGFPHDEQPSASTAEAPGIHDHIQPV